MIKNFEQFNESFGSKLNEIKLVAKEYVESGDFYQDIKSAGISKKNIIKTIREVESVKNKFGGPESLIKKVKDNLDKKNESIMGMVTLSALGLHYTIKTLIAIKNGYGFKKYLAKLFATDSSELRIVRDVFFSITLIIYSISYFLCNSLWSNDIYQLDQGVYTEWSMKWDGINDYKIIDSYGKVYIFKYNILGDFDIMYNDKKIGIYKNDRLYRLDMSACIYDNSPGKDEIYGTSKVDLEKFLLSKPNKKTIERDKENKKAIERNKKMIDSLRQDIVNRSGTILENVAQSKKLLKDIGIDYDLLPKDISNIIDGRWDESSKKFLNEFRKTFDRIPPIGFIMSFDRMKYTLTNNNNIGYLSLFTKFYIEYIKNVNEIVRGHTQEFSDEKFVSSWMGKFNTLYQKILSNKDIISNLRSEGKIKNVLEFETYESLDDALNRLDDWRIVNSFIKKLPPTQKSLIWSNGYFIDSLQSKSQFLTKVIKSISENEKIQTTFLTKISSIKTTDQLLNNLYRLSSDKPWFFDYWLDLLDKRKDVIVTWKSKEENQILCAVFGYEALKDIAYMTNWCIVRDSYYYNKYTSEGRIQYVFYDFNRKNDDNECIIGTTLNSDFSIYASHNKSDYRKSLPDKFFENKLYHEVNKKYFKFTTTQMIKKLNMGLAKVVMNSFRRFLSKGRISKFLDYYEN